MFSTAYPLTNSRIPLSKSSNLSVFSVPNYAQCVILWKIWIYNIGPVEATDNELLLQHTQHKRKKKKKDMKSSTAVAATATWKAKTNICKNKCWKKKRRWRWRWVPNGKKRTIFSWNCVIAEWHFYRAKQISINICTTLTRTNRRTDGQTVAHQSLDWWW